MSDTLPLGPHARMDAYAKAKGWVAGGLAELGNQPVMTRRQYQRWWSKYQRWARLPADRKRHDDN